MEEAKNVCSKGGACEQNFGMKQEDVEGRNITSDICKKCERDMSVKVSAGIRELRKND